MRLLRLGLAVAALAGATACQQHPTRSAPVPSVSAVVVRNTSVFDVGIYAVPSDDGSPVWLATVPAKATWQVPISARVLRSDRTIVIKTQAIGSIATWTSQPVEVDQDNFGLLDLSVTRTGNTSLSALRVLNAVELSPSM
jgi:hypothetical protein